VVLLSAAPRRADSADTRWRCGARTMSQPLLRVEDPALPAWRLHATYTLQIAWFAGALGNPAAAGACSSQGRAPSSNKTGQIESLDQLHAI